MEVGLGAILAAAGGSVASWEAIQFLLNKFIFDKKKDKNEERAGEIQNFKAEFDLIKAANETLASNLAAAEERQKMLWEMIQVLQKEKEERAND